MANLRFGGKWLVSACTAVGITMVAFTVLLMLVSSMMPFLLRNQWPEWTRWLPFGLLSVVLLAGWRRRKARRPDRHRDPALRIT